MNSTYFKPLQMVDSLGIPLLWPPAEVLSLTLKESAKLVPLKALMMPFDALFQLLLHIFFFSHMHRWELNELFESIVEKEFQMIGKYEKELSPRIHPV